MWFQVIEAGVRVPLYSCIVAMDLALHLGQMTGLCMQTELQQLHFLLMARMLSLGRMTQPHTTAHIWDTVSGNEVVPPFRGHSDAVFSVVFSADCTRITSGSCENSPCASVWNATTGAEIIVLQEENYEFYGAVTFSPDGTRMATGSDNTVCIWDTVSGTLVVALEGHRGDAPRSYHLGPPAARLVNSRQLDR
jgi:WD40 repeat protein